VVSGISDLADFAWLHVFWIGVAAAAVFATAKAVGRRDFSRAALYMVAVPAAAGMLWLSGRLLDGAG